MKNSKLSSERTPATLLQQKLENAERIAILGIGSELRGDDAAGILAARQIEKGIGKAHQSKICHSERSEESGEAILSKAKDLFHNTPDASASPQHDKQDGSQTLRAVYPERSERTQGDTKTPDVRVFIGETAPENLTGEIKRYQPTHLIIIDSADLDIEPGQIRLINPDEIGGTSFCTHTLPTSVLTDYLLKSFKCEVIVIGIQPKTLAFGSSPSKETLQAVKQLSAAIIKLYAF